MPFSILGIGTDLIGERDHAPDGSYLTTEWFVLLCLPVFPFRSLRVIPAEDRPWPPWPIYHHSYRALSETSPSPRQVASVYAFFAAYAAWLACWWQTLDLFGTLRLPEEWLVPVVFAAAAFVVLLSPFAVPLYLRRRSRISATTSTYPFPVPAARHQSCARCSGKRTVAVSLGKNGGVILEPCPICSGAPDGAAKQN
jgi:hypothetical protein